MSHALKFQKVSFDNMEPRIGGGALIGNFFDWPETPDGIPLTLLMSLPTDFINLHTGAGLPAEQVISVFTYYSANDYFLDAVTYHGSPEELSELRKGYTRVMRHEYGGELYGPVSIPARVIEVQGTFLDPAIPFGGSKIGGAPTLLQAESMELGSEQFILQVYGANLPKPYQGIFGLSDAPGYLYVRSEVDESPAEAGTFFVQVT